MTLLGVNWRITLNSTLEEQAEVFTVLRWLGLHPSDGHLSHSGKRPGSVKVERFLTGWASIGHWQVNMPWTLESTVLTMYSNTLHFTHRACSCASSKRDNVLTQHQSTRLHFGDDTNLGTHWRALSSGLLLERPDVSQEVLVQRLSLWLTRNPTSRQVEAQIQHSAILVWHLTPSSLENIYRRFEESLASIFIITAVRSGDRLWMFAYFPDKLDLHLRLRFSSSPPLSFLSVAWSH